MLSEKNYENSTIIIEFSKESILNLNCPLFHLYRYKRKRVKL